MQIFTHPSVIKVLKRMSMRIEHIQVKQTNMSFILYKSLSLRHIYIIYNEELIKAIQLSVLKE